MLKEEKELKKEYLPYEILEMMCADVPRIKLARDIHLKWAKTPELYRKYEGLSSPEWDIDWARFYQKQLTLCELWNRYKILKRLKGNKAKKAVKWLII
jgi:hypothetical protein